MPPKTIYAIDPGTTESALVVWDGDKIADAVIAPNEQMLSLVESYAAGKGVLAIEQICSYGMPVGKETFETVFWSGRFAQVWAERGGQFEQVPRLKVKMHLCHSSKAKDSNVWQALVDRFGAPGKKSSPGLLYPLKSHTRAAFALAVYWMDTRAEVQP